jgi:hypothetical protein
MKIWPIALLMLAGCATVDRPEPAPAGPCIVSDQARMRFVGTEFREHQRMNIQYETSARIARVLRPGDAATMDIRPDRLNILVDDAGLIAGLRCG